MAQPLTTRKNGKYRSLIACDRLENNISEHILVAEKAMGKEMPKGAEVHHWNEDGVDNRNENLVVCESPEYHQLLHTRMRAKKACGHAHWRRCAICKKHDDPKNVSISGRYVYHKKCHTEYNRRLRSRTMHTNDRAHSNVGREL